MTYINEIGRMFKVKETNGRFFYWSPRGLRWLSIAKDKVNFG